jgi:hypothetical protein
MPHAMGRDVGRAASRFQVPPARWLARAPRIRNLTRTGQLKSEVKDRTQPVTT